MDTVSSREEPSCLAIEEEASLFTGKKANKVAGDARRWSSVVNATLVVVIMTAPPVLILLSGRLGPPAVWITSTVAALGAQREHKKDVLLGGLLAPGFDEESCTSRYQSVYYRKNMTRRPAPYLIRRLREQEALQRRCGPGTETYRRASEWLKSGQKGAGAAVDGCGYLVLVSYRGLGNRVLAMASAFLYAMLTNRVLLVDRGKTLADLLCEPFPGATWMLPLDFPLEHFGDLGEGSPESYGNVVLNKTVVASELNFVYLHLDHDASPANKLAYCDDHRQFLHPMQWVVMRADHYFTPVMFLNPAYRVL